MVCLSTKHTISILLLYIVYFILLNRSIFNKYSKNICSLLFARKDNIWTIYDLIFTKHKNLDNTVYKKSITIKTLSNFFNLKKNLIITLAINKNIILL